MSPLTSSRQELWEMREKKWWISPLSLLFLVELYTES